MTDFVIAAPDAATLLAAAQSMGFADAAGNIVTQGRIPGDADPYASYFLNVVGPFAYPTGATVADANGNPLPVMATDPRYWSRLRINGDNPFTRGLITIPASLTVYAPVTLPDGTPAWVSTADGSVGPSWIGTVGVIA